MLKEIAREARPAQAPAIPPLGRVAAPTAPAPKLVPALKKSKATPAPAPVAARRPARPARPRRRHGVILLSFLVLVLAPLALAAWYLSERAADQYVSQLGFTVRQEEAPSPAGLLGGLAQLSTGTSSDTDVLFEYIQSQDLMQRVDASLDLRARYGMHSEQDPIFGFPPDGSIEDLVAYWRRMVQVSYNPGSGMLDLRIFGFNPREAQMIAEEILDQSTRVINELTAIAREDALGYARADLAEAQEALKEARARLTAFRSQTQIIDPAQDLTGQMGLIGTLQAQLAGAVVDLALLRETTRESDPRIAQAKRRVSVIEQQIEAERAKLGQGSEARGGDYAATVAEFERLTVEREFAEETYLAALSAFNTARAEAQRQSRYLAAYLQPTLAESPAHPRHLVLLGLLGLFLLLGWSILVLIYYGLRDRR